MAAASLTIAANAEPMFPTDHLTVNTSKTFLQQSLQSMGNPSVVTANGVFVSLTLGGYTYWVAKALLYNATLGEMTMGVVVSPADNWTRFMALTDFDVFLKNGDRTFLHLPDPNLNSPDLTLDPPQPQQACPTNCLTA